MVDNDIVRHTEAPHSSQGPTHRSTDKRHICALHPMILQNPPPSLAQNPEGCTLLQQHPELVLVGKLHNLRHGSNLPCRLVQPLNNDEAPVQRLGRPSHVPLSHELQQPLQIRNIVVPELLHVRTRQLQTRLHSKVDGLIAHNEVPTLEEGGNDARDSCNVIRIDDSRLGAHELRQLLLKLEVHVNRPIKPSRPTGSHTVLADSSLTSVFHPFLV
mmetsp:Transcript_5439/g.13804  ORF Transcript_5439/g.13804 Transcript_5439/m.13804 type:complete len:215 (-) Transcript_5439:623-1267(-)